MTELTTLGRKKTGSYYTTSLLARYMARESIHGLLMDRIMNTPSENIGNVDIDVTDLNSFLRDNMTKNVAKRLIDLVKSLKICDNAVGDGIFLIAAGEELLALHQKACNALDHDLPSEPGGSNHSSLFSSVRDIKEHILRHNLHGVDIRAEAVESCKLNLLKWLTSTSQLNNSSSRQELETIRQIDHNIREGNSLIGFVDIDDITGETRSKAGDDDGIKGENELQALHIEIAGFHEKIDLYCRENEPEKDERDLLVDMRKSIYSKLDERLLKSLSSKNISIEEIKGLKLFHWIVDFFPVIRTGGFDIIMGNPPWYIIEEETSKKVLSSLYTRQSGQPDLYRFFIERSHQLCKEGGYFTYVTPRSWLTINAARNLRKDHLSKFDLFEVLQVPSEAFAGIHANVIAFIAKRVNQEKTGRNRVIISGKLIKEGEEYIAKRTSTLPREYVRSPDYTISTGIDHTLRILRDRAVSRVDTVSLKDIADYTVGYQLYHNTLHTREEITNKIHHSKEKKAGWSPEIRAKNISRFFIDPEPAGYVNSAVPFFRLPADRFLKGERILLREIPGKEGFIAARTSRDILFPKSVLSIVMKKKTALFTNRDILAFLCSKFCLFEFRVTAEKGMQELFPRISAKSLNNLSIATNVSNTGISELVDRLEILYRKRHELTNARRFKSESESETAKSRNLYSINKEIDKIRLEIDATIFKAYDFNRKELTIVLNFLEIDSRELEEILECWDNT
ncbi:MAG: Eco57I restriction-modification methylase domain-containing protein [Candidatus Hodarchaeales archaeon]